MQELGRAIRRVAGCRLAGGRIARPSSVSAVCRVRWDPRRLRTCTKWEWPRSALRAKPYWSPSRVRFHTITVLSLQRKRRTSQQIAFAVARECSRSSPAASLQSRGNFACLPGTGWGGGIVTGEWGCCLLTAAFADARKTPKTAGSPRRGQHSIGVGVQRRRDGRDPAGMSLQLAAKAECLRHAVWRLFKRDRAAVRQRRRGR